MALARRPPRQRHRYWPGFVDALSTLMLAIMFLLTVFMVAQFFLSQEVSGKDTALPASTAQISRADRAAVAGAGRQDEPRGRARACGDLALGVEGERDRLQRSPTKARRQAARGGEAEVGRLSSQTRLEKAVTARALAQVEILNQQIAALRRQTRRARGGARRLREEGPGIAGRASPISASA